MTDQTVDTTAWASLVRELLDERGLDPKTAAAPLGPVPAFSDTIRRWRDGPRGAEAKRRSVGVDLKSVRDFCRAMEYPVRDALVRVGFLTAEEAGIGLAPTTAPTGVHKLALTVNRLLRNQRIPEEKRDYFEWLIEGTVKFFLRQMRLPPGPVEASARDLAAGAPRITEPRPRSGR